MKILQVTPYFNPAWAYGGPPRTVYELSKALAKRGHEVIVYTTDAFDNNSRIDVKSSPVHLEGLEVYYFRNLSNYLAWNHQLFISSDMVKVFRTQIHSFDIVHLHMYRTFQNVMAHYYCKKFGVPYIVTAHGSMPNIIRKIWLKSFFDRIYGHKIVRDAECFVGVSKAETSQYMAFGVPENKITTIPNGIDIYNYQNLPKTGYFKERLGLNNRKIVLYLGRINARKGLDFLLRSFKQMNRNDVVLILVGGDDGYGEYLKKLAKDLGIESRIIFLEPITHPNKLNMFIDADVVVYPAIYEIFGLVPFEAILCNKPVIVTDDCGCGDIMKKSDGGYIVKYNDVKGLSDMMGYILDNPEEASIKVQHGKEYIMKNLNWNVIAAQTEDLYADVLKSHRE